MARDTDEGVYDEDSRNDMVDDDELSPEEAGFMQGYDNAEADDEVIAKEKEEEE